MEQQLVGGERAPAGGRSLNLFVCALEATEGGEGSRSLSS